MQKTYGPAPDGMPHAYHPGYYPDVGYSNKYDTTAMYAGYQGSCSPIGDTTSLGNYYHHQPNCAIQGPLMGSGGGDPTCGGMVDGGGGLYDPNGYISSCGVQGNGCPPGMGPLHPNSVMPSKQHEIYPWMKESRQQNKQRQAQVTGKICSYFIRT